MNNNKAHLPKGPSNAEVLDEHWRQAGATDEDIERSRQVGDLFDALVASGRDARELADEWRGKTAFEIPRTYGTRHSVTIA